LKRILFTAMLILCFTSVQAIAAAPVKVKIKTSMGEILLHLDAEKAPKTVENFVQYASQGFFDGTVFHRVIRGFMIQGGGLSADLATKPTARPITNEGDNGLKNYRGTIAMARTGDPHSATSQFFINTVDNASLDHKDKSPQGWGYCVFGKVVEGMDVVDRIEATPTTMRQGYRDVPVQPVTIETVTVLK
jgi:peptidyl-prolyl cis-trans isomerase B (cyclophilin B)